MPTIWDINQLRPLQAIGRRQGVMFTLQGGVAFRFALRLASPKFEPPLDLFELTPFTSDVDLVHSGPSEKTGPLLEAILAEIPSAECFRWELHSEADDRPYQDALMRGNLVPARLLKLSSDPVVGLIDPAHGFAEFQGQSLRYQRNPLFRSSPFARSGRDLEALSALLYLQSQFEFGGFNPRLIPPTVASVFATSADWETRRQLEKHAYLRCRLRYLLVNAVAAHPSRAGLRNVAQSIGLRAFVKAIAGADNPVRMDSTFFDFLASDEEPADFVLASSARLSGDTLRLPLTTQAWFPAASSQALPDLGADQEVLLVSPELVAEPGQSQSSQIGFSSLPQEFVYFQFPPNLTQKMSLQDRPWIRDEDISAFLMIKSSGKSDWAPYAVPSVVERRAIGSHSRKFVMSVKINCLGLFGVLARNNAVSVKFCLVAWTAGKE